MPSPCAARGHRHLIHRGRELRAGFPGPEGRERAFPSFPSRVVRGTGARQPRRSQAGTDEARPSKRKGSYPCPTESVWPRPSPRPPRLVPNPRASSASCFTFQNVHLVKETEAYWTDRPLRAFAGCFFTTWPAPSVRTRHTRGPRDELTQPGGVSAARASRRRSPRGARVFLPPSSATVLWGEYFLSQKRFTRCSWPLTVAAYVHLITPAVARRWFLAESQNSLFTMGYPFPRLPPGVPLSVSRMSPSPVF